MYTHTHIYTEREIERNICFKKLAHAIMETGKSKICRVVCQAGEQGMSWCL